MKQYKYKLISNDKIVIDVNIDILAINTKRGTLHILPSFTLTYHTIGDYVIFDLNWLIFELKIYIFL